jgi:hypothetical protein
LGKTTRAWGGADAVFHPILTVRSPKACENSRLAAARPVDRSKTPLLCPPSGIAEADNGLGATTGRFTPETRHS